MPYSGANLPKNVQALPAVRRRQWLRIFNAVKGKTGDEGAAFRQANGRMKEYDPRLPFIGDYIGAKDLIDILSDHEFWADAKTAMIGAVEPEMRSIFDAGVAFALTLDVPGYKRKGKDFLDLDPEDVDDVASRLFRNYVDDWWLQLETTTRDRLRSAIIRASQEGTGTPGVIREIEELFGPTRARRIGVTETTRLFGRGAVATYEAAGLEGWAWRTAEDRRVCPTCDALSGQQFPIDETFNPAHVSCRCFAAPLTRLRRRGRREGALGRLFEVA